MEPIKVIHSYPLLVYKRKGIFSIILIVSFSVASYVLTHNFLVFILSFLIMTMPVVTFLFPSTYRFFETEFIKEQLYSPLTVPYNKYKKFKVLEDGVLLFKKRRNEYLYIFNEEDRKLVREVLLKNGLEEII